MVKISGINTLTNTWPWYWPQFAHQFALDHRATIARQVITTGSPAMTPVSSGYLTVFARTNSPEPNTKNDHMSLRQGTLYDRLALALANNVFVDEVSLGRLV